MTSRHMYGSIAYSLLAGLICYGVLRLVLPEEVVISYITISIVMAVALITSYMPPWFCLALALIPIMLLLGAKEGIVEATLDGRIEEWLATFSFAYLYILTGILALPGIVRR